MAFLKNDSGLPIFAFHKESKKRSSEVQNLAMFQYTLPSKMMLTILSKLTEAVDAWVDIDENDCRKYE